MRASILCYSIQNALDVVNTNIKIKSFQQNGQVAGLCQTIRIFNGCEVRIENSVTRVTVRHREAYDFFSCILFIQQLHLSLNFTQK